MKLKPGEKSESEAHNSIPGIVEILVIILVIISLLVLVFV